MCVSVCVFRGRKRMSDPLYIDVRDIEHCLVNVAGH